jgi:hypothetical protein
LVTDPQTGHLIDCGTRRYRPSQALTDYLLARERVSAFPGSTVPSTRCDIDHTTTQVRTKAVRGGPWASLPSPRPERTAFRPDAPPTGHTYQHRPYDYRLGP